VIFVHNRAFNYVRSLRKSYRERVILKDFYSDFIMLKSSYS
jgi:hypothetical protein